MGPAASVAPAPLGPGLMSAWPSGQGSASQVSTHTKAAGICTLPALAAPPVPLNPTEPSQPHLDASSIAHLCPNFTEPLLHL
jgi:hypothetical protein